MRRFWFPRGAPIPRPPCGPQTGGSDFLIAQARQGVPSGLTWLHRRFTSLPHQNLARVCPCSHYVQQANTQYSKNNIAHLFASCQSDQHDPSLLSPIPCRLHSLFSCFPVVSLPASDSASPLIKHIRAPSYQCLQKTRPPAHSPTRKLAHSQTRPPPKSPGTISLLTRGTATLKWPQGRGRLPHWSNCMPTGYSSASPPGMKITQAR